MSKRKTLSGGYRGSGNSAGCQYRPWPKENVAANYYNKELAAGNGII